MPKIGDNLDLLGNGIANVLDPTNAQDVATKHYVDLLPTNVLTFTNKRITKRVQTFLDVAAITPDLNSFDCGAMLALSQDLTIQNPTGTPTAIQGYILRIFSAVQRNISWGTLYKGGSVQALPGTTVGGVHVYYGFIWNEATGHMDLVAYNPGF